MDKLIEALQIFIKYGNPSYPTCCEHDVLHVGIDPSIVSSEDIQKLDELHFMAGEEDFYSFHFGSA